MKHKAIRPHLKSKSLFKGILLGLLLFAGAKANARQELSLKETYRVPAPKARFAVNVEPIWLVVSGLGGKAEYFISDKISLGLGGIYIPNHRAETSSSDSSNSKSIKYNWEHSEVVLGSNIMITGTLASSGFYVNPGVGYQHTAVTDYSDFGFSGSVDSPFFRMTGGYQWITSTKFRFGLGAGVALHPTSDIVIADNSGKEVYREKNSQLSGLALDLHVGYVF